MSRLLVHVASVALVSLALLTSSAAAEEVSRAKLETVRHPARAYEGAPPTIPHWYDSQNGQACLKCHLTGLDVGFSKPAPMTPHPTWTNCMQCHVRRASPDQAALSSRFVGLGFAGTTHRAYPGAPPVIPHPFFGRENCVACHGGPGTPAEIKTTHPERTSCLQCHALDRLKQIQH